MIGYICMGWPAYNAELAAKLDIIDGRLSDASCLVFEFVAHISTFKESLEYAFKFFLQVGHLIHTNFSFLQTLNIANFHIIL